LRIQPVQGRDQTNQTRRLISPSPTFGHSSGINPNNRNLIDTQGAIFSTGRALDVAIVGSGFLVTNTQLDGSGDTLLTRAGSLDRRVVDATQQAFLTDQNGNFIQGFPADGNGGFSVGATVSALQPIRIDRGAALSAARATSTATIAANLPASAAVGANFNLDVGVFDNLGTPHALVLDFARNAAINTWNLVATTVDGIVAPTAAVATTAAAVSANLPDNAVPGTTFSLSVGVFDNLGTPHTLVFDVTRNAAVDTWDVVSSTVDGDVTAGSPVTITFDALGQILAPSSQSVSIAWTNPATAAPSTIAVDLSAMTQFGGGFTPSVIRANGNAIGTLESVSINERGEVVGRFSNGLSEGLAKLPIAVVRNINGLTSIAGTNFAVNATSGPIRLLQADQTDFATFAPAALEGSTVELAVEFSKLIITQRAYSSAARTIQVVDEMFQIATRLKG
jgi:flagellar hook protein FlgE